MEEWKPRWMDSSSLPPPLPSSHSTPPTSLSFARSPDHAHSVQHSDRPPRPSDVQDIHPMDGWECTPRLADRRASELDGGGDQSNTPEIILTGARGCWQRPLERLPRGGCWQLHAPPRHFPSGRRTRACAARTARSSTRRTKWQSGRATHGDFMYDRH